MERNDSFGGVPPGWQTRIKSGTWVTSLRGKLFAKSLWGCLNNVEIQVFPGGYVIDWNLFQGHNATEKGSVLVARIVNNLSWSAS